MKTWVLGLLVLGCGQPAARHAPVQASVPAPSGALASDDAGVVAAELVGLARAGDVKALDALVDWPYVRRLAALSGAFAATLPDLVATLRSLPARCVPEWRVSDGGLRLDFPPAMVDDPPAVAAEKDRLHRELYQGRDVVATCVSESEDLYQDGHSEQLRIPQERLMVQLVRAPSGRWHLRGWSRLTH